VCGIAGLARARPGERPERADLERMARTLVHRGPDDEGIFVGDGIGLAFRRLSIIDLSGGHQPLFNEERDVALVMNGEIYNYRELRADLVARGHAFRTDSDAEVLVHLYEEHGADLVDHLVGMYAFAVADLRGPAPRLVLGRDRLGIKPLFWSWKDGELAFASEPKAILELERTPRELRPEALLDYLVQGYCGGELSAWSGLHRLPPSGVLTWTRGEEPRVTRTWDLPTDALRGPTDDEEVLAALDEAVRARLMADVPLGAFLSGGVDSTAVATSMVRSSADPVRLCSVGFREASHDELDLARATAKRLGAVHHTEVLEADPAPAVDVLPWFYDEPHADPSTVPTWLVSRMAREHVTVALSGDGGDETFAGYRRYLHDVAENRLRRAIGGPGRAFARAAGRVYPRLERAPRVLRGKTFLTNVGDDPARAYWRSVTRIDRADALELLAPDLRARLLDHDPFEEFARHYRRPDVDDPLYRAQYADFHTYLPDQILAKVDRASMAVSLEVRVPLLDHRFCGAFANLPREEKIRGGRGKHALRRALRDRLPVEVLDGEKRGFDTPLAAWLRGPLRAAAHAAVEELPADWFDRARLRGLLAEHDAGQRDHGRLLWSLLVLEHWRRRHRVAGLVA
jgi:asparagine synthase (glutamine-hydrolysing)